MRRRSFLATPLLLPTLGLAAAAEAAPAYPPVTPGVRLAFPRDHGAHPEFRSEWWYVTGALDSPRRDTGFQLTFFRSRPGTLLLTVTLIFIAFAIAIPYLPFSSLFGFIPLPGSLMLAVIGLTMLYVLAIELTKKFFYSHQVNTNI